MNQGTNWPPAAGTAELDSNPRKPRSRPREKTTKAGDSKDWLIPFRTLTIAVVVGVAALVAVGTGTMMMTDSAKTAPPTQFAAGRPSVVPEMSAAGLDIRDFLTDYYALLPTGQDRAWQLLSPRYQAKVGGFASFHGFYATVASIQVTDVQVTGADTARATLRFIKKDGRVSIETYLFTISSQDGTTVITDAGLVAR